MPRSGPAPRGRRAITAAAAVGLLLSLLTACTGDGAVRDFAAAFADDPAVASLELTSHDNQPFTGGVSGDVVADDELTDEEFAALVARVSDYTAAHGTTMRGRVTVVGPDVSLPVSGVTTEDATRVAFLLALREQPGFVAGSLTGDDAVSLSVRVLMADDAFAVAGLVPALADDAGVAGSMDVTARTDDDTTVLTDLSEARLTEAAAVWSAVSHDVTVSGIRADDTVTTVALEHESDLAAAEAASAQVGSVTPIRFESDRVRLGNADGTIARSLLGLLDDPTRELVRFVWESEGAVQVMAVDASAVPALVTPVGSSASQAGAQSAHVRAEGGTSVTVDLPRPDELATLTIVLAQLVAADAVTSIAIGPRSARITAPDASDAEVDRFTELLVEFGDPGTRVCVERDDRASCTTVAR
ncbi:hypothetical protein MUN76_14585 [Leucobacter rhizosphaerae]|uniref:Uncharacterized protein n=1 Tax=Leucobacter rhizosphaerae TaxID=2932245 RepID=A0ABY4FVE4_9MICO|nr:hypothetical protein [Leucobacter rhizosphaerae]UOQ60242.1 hypothetical protein MUN76_14585 [Leucobacter rhizosphaerae]